MSCYFYINLKCKGQKAKEAPCILCLYNDEARELALVADLVCNGGPDMSLDDEYGYYTRLTLDTLHEIQNYYSEESKRYQDIAIKNSKELAEYKEMMPKASNVKIFKALREECDNSESLIKQAQDDAEIADRRYHDFIQLERILTDNEGYELVYYLG